ncbi:MAG: NADH-quinone oxidoreductase subunit M [Polyangia bacterium]|jgi:NADH-quinone oxidoreductase subunit M|nr:NADH-quinone oxidoreductase subunit M [Polyangia bacterium]
MILTAIVFLPLLAALVTMLLPKEDKVLLRNFGVASTSLIFLFSLLLLWKFDGRVGGMQPSLSVNLAWLQSLGIRYQMGVDGISLFLVLLTTFLTPIAILGAGGSVTKRHREFVAAMLVLETGMLGAFVALDMVLFYVFWELMLVPMYLLIGIWGGERRIYAAIKFVIYTMVGSVLMLVAIIYLYLRFHELTGQWTFSLLEWNRMVLTPKEQLLCFGAFALSFAIKVPIFPLHTWLPDAHVEAPTPGSVILAGVLLKMGTYGILRFAMPLFPYAATKLAPYLAILGIVGIIYGALLAYAQKDAKKLIAYSSISHLGFVILGLMSLTIQGTQGAIYIMIAHGITSAGLFLGFGILYDRRHTRLMSEYGGIWKVMPTYSALYMIIMLGSVGLPGLCGFIGEFLVLLGAYDHQAFVAFQSGPVMLSHPKLMTSIAALGVIFSALYLLVMFQRIFFGPVKHEVNQDLPDATGVELGALVPLVVLVFVLGLVPSPLLRRMEPSVKLHLAQFVAKQKASEEIAKADIRKAFVLPRAVLDAAALKDPSGMKAHKMQKGKKFPELGMRRGRSARTRGTTPVDHPQGPAVNEAAGAREPSRQGRRGARGAAQPGGAPQPFNTITPMDLPRGLRLGQKRRLEQEVRYQKRPPLDPKAAQGGR